MTIAYQESESDVSMSSIKSISIASSQPEDVSDKDIENNFRMLLKHKRNGKYMHASIVAHLEYFNYTLNAEHLNDPSHENPFKNVEAYPAL